MSLPILVTGGGGGVGSDLPNPNPARRLPFLVAFASRDAVRLLLPSADNCQELIKFKPVMATQSRRLGAPYRELLGLFLPGQT